MEKCKFTPKTFAQAEVGCPLDHAACGVHITKDDNHEENCKECQEMKRAFDESHIELDEFEF